MAGAGDQRVARLRALAAAKRHFYAFHAPRVPSHADAAAERAFMETGALLSVMQAGDPLAVRAWGQGPTVLLVHGLFLSGGKFSSLVPALVAAGFRAVVFDVPGHGQSHGAFVDADNIADAIFAVEDATGPFAGVVAHSMGAIWTLRALHSGLDVPNVVCIGAPFGVSAVEYYVDRNDLAGDVAMHFRRLTDAFSLGTSSPLETAAALRGRALIVHDRDDPLAPFEGGQQLAAAWSQSSSLWTSRLGHFKTLATRQVIDAVVGFLSEASASRWNPSEEAAP